MRSSLISNRSLIILLAALLAPAMQAFGESAYITETSKAAEAKKCVDETDKVRRNHMDLLKHGRDETVREGKRGITYSLSECIECHASRNAQGEAVPVNDEGEFCQTCHGYVAVTPPCFQCHRTTPEEGSKGNQIGYHPSEFESDNNRFHHQPVGIQRD
ncbi:MAG: sulfur reduction protein DsrJ [Candidatus Thiodiazotropha sp.]|jgi:hypothetical protein